MENKLPENPAGTVGEQPASQSPQQFLTGSALAAAPRPPLPAGIYVIVILNVLGFLYGGASEASGAGSVIALIINFIVMAATIGMLFRLEAARKAAFILAVISAVVAVLTVAGLFITQNMEHASAAKTQHTLEQAQNIATLTSTQQADLQKKIQTISKDQAAYDRMNLLAILYTGASALLYAGEAAYLGRQSVKDVFELLKQ